MQIPGLPGLLFLAYLLIVLPLGARRTARRLHDAQPVTRLSYWRAAVAAQAVLLILAWIAGSTFDYRIFAAGDVERVDLLLGLAAFVVCYGLRLLSRHVRTEEELRALSVYARAPRTRAELFWFTLAVAAASAAEEAAYRGVGWSILWYATGSGWIAAVLMALAFALAHWSQGWKSGVTIFALALVMHGLVALTGTLVVAMAVHAAYDFLVGHQIRRRALEYDAAGVPA